MKEWVATQSRPQVLYSPTYCSHLNPVEHNWLRMKNRIAANRLYGSAQRQPDAVAQFFIGMSPEQAQEWTVA